MKLLQAELDHWQNQETSAQKLNDDLLFLINKYKREAKQQQAQGFFLTETNDNGVGDPPSSKKEQRGDKSSLTKAKSLAKALTRSKSKKRSLSKKKAR